VLDGRICRSVITKSENGDWIEEQTHKNYFATIIMEFKGNDHTVTYKIGDVTGVHLWKKIS
ncbi:unnamed protein product, partial [Allacma fusca]